MLACEAGVTLSDILAMLSRPVGKTSGWLLPVMPGTRFVTVAGAIANDVHGKNHHLHGTFGRHVLSFNLARGDGSVVTCSRKENAELFAATIGGLGLTGIILRVTIKLRRVEGTGVEAEDIRFTDLDGFFRLTEESDTEWEYTAAWIDCSARGGKLGRGIFSRARHRAGSQVLAARAPRLAVSVSPPISLVNGLSVRAFNAAYWRLAGRRAAPRLMSYAVRAVPAGRCRSLEPSLWASRLLPVPMRRPEGDRTARADGDDARHHRFRAGLGAGRAEDVRRDKLPWADVLSDARRHPCRRFRQSRSGDATASPKAGRAQPQGGRALYPAKDAAMTTAAFKAGYPNLDVYRHKLRSRLLVGLRQACRHSPELSPSVPALTIKPSRIAIFGATSDISNAVARRLAEDGARLVLVARDAAALAAAAADLGVRARR